MSPTFEWQRTGRLSTHATRPVDEAAVRALRDGPGRAPFRTTVPDGIDVSGPSSDARIRRTLVCDDVVVGFVAGTSGRLAGVDASGPGDDDAPSTPLSLEIAPPPTGTLLVDDVLFAPPPSLDASPGRVVATAGLARTTQALGLQRTIVPVRTAYDATESPYTPTGYLEQCRAGAITDPTVTPFLRRGFRLRIGGSHSEDSRVLALLEWQSPRGA